jgi:hypothetical protein
MTQSRATAYRSQMKTGLHRFHDPKLQEARTTATMDPVAVGPGLELCTVQVVGSPRLGQTTGRVHEALLGRRR